MALAAPPGTDDELVDALTEAEDHLAFARRCLSRSGVHDRTTLNRRVAALEQRLRDPAHHLAVVGEFSSGKSTLINALLRDPLLVSHALPTTRAVTRIRHAPELRLRCRFHGETVEYTYPGSYGQPRLPQRLRRMGPGAGVPAAARDLLGVLTADERVAPEVAEVVVEHPAAVLASGLVLVDTPGTNAEAGHTALARRVLADEADAAVVLVPADNPLGSSLVEFLTDAFDGGMLGRCIFLVTRMAHVPENECDRLLDVVHERIRRSLGIDDPAVLPVSVGAVVRELRGRPPRPDEQRWVQDFPRVEQELLHLVARRRPIAVSDRVLALLHRLLADVRTDLEAEDGILVVEAAAVADSTLTDVISFGDAASRRTARELAPVLARAQRLVDDAAEAFRRSVVDAAVAAVAEGPADRRNRIETTVHAQVTRLTEQCRAALGPVGAASIRLAESVDRAAAVEYAKLTPAARSAMPRPVLPALDVPALSATSFEAVWALQAEHDSTENAMAGGGAVAGAVLGTMVLPVVGTAIGALLGAGGALLLGAEKREAALRDQVRTSTAQFATRVVDGVRQDARVLTDTAGTAVEQRIRTVQEHYAPLVAAVVEDHRARGRQLSRRQAALAAELAEVARRAAVVDERRRRLAARGR